MERIVLKTTESDIQEFYVNVFGGKILKKSSLFEKDAVKKYHMPMPLEVYEMQLQDIKLDLLVCEDTEEDCLQHIFLELNDTSNIFAKAIENNLQAYMRNRDGSEFYYIKDHNNNLLEFENKKSNKELQFA